MAPEVVICNASIQCWEVCKYKEIYQEPSEERKRKEKGNKMEGEQREPLSHGFVPFALGIGSSG